ncbi:MAG: hypothetical protein JRG91_11540 [Deltaproteobacteria bacterium]|nr:hypothetical protein [Deltaproteobacteria bacterium]
MNEKNDKGPPTDGPTTEEISLEDVHSTYTRPLSVTSMTSAPTTTLTQRPWTVLITLAVSLLCTIALAVISAFGSYNTAETTLAKLVKALIAADLDTLIEDPELGFKERAERDIKQRGLEEYNQILSAFNACSTAGLEQYKTLQQTVLLRGEEAFKKLPGDQQRTIKQKSKTTWLLQNGLAALGKEGNRGIDDPAVFEDPKRATPHVTRLGLAALAAKGEENLPDAETLSSWTKPKTAQKALIARVKSAGEGILEKLRKEAVSAGLKRFKSLTPRERKNISSASYRLWVVTKGVELLEEQERELVTGPEMFLETTDEEAEARRLCLLILPPAQKALLEGRDYDDFMAKRDDYIRSTGRERYERFLAALFRSCEYEIVKSTMSGDDSHDLLRISTAQFSLRWKECPGAAQFLGRELTFHYQDGSWRFEPGAAADVIEVEDAPEPPEKPGAGEEAKP